MHRSVREVRLRTKFRVHADSHATHLYAARRVHGLVTQREPDTLKRESDHCRCSKSCLNKEETPNTTNASPPTITKIGPIEAEDAG